ncbi:MAG: hypothetical protein RIS79_2597 [Verrucomicrobiota bacterium]|jgi:prepilin-type N-terminal cleavage/methylation domain-containing protein
MKTNTPGRNVGFTLIELLVVITIIAILAGLAIPAGQAVLKMARQNQATNNCRQVIMALKQFAAKNQSQYPDSVLNPLTGGTAQHANEAFHLLFQQRVIDDERIFGSPAGYSPDGIIGKAPAFDRAVTANENHWAMTAGLTDTSASNVPLVFENPVASAWPPPWNASVAGQIRPGRTWTGGQVIIGRQDGSAEVVDLNASTGMVTVPQKAGGMDIFTQATDGQTQGILLPVVKSGVTKTKKEDLIDLPGTQPKAEDPLKPRSPIEN